MKEKQTQQTLRLPGEIPSRERRLYIFLNAFAKRGERF
jgi:hypothetical protein